MKKKFAIIFTCILLACSMIIPSFAASTGNVVMNSNNLVGLIEVDENTRGADVPTNGWNVATSGTYSFDGSSDTVTLYTAYYFTGKTSYYVTANNRQSTAQVVKAKKLSNNNKIEEYSIPANGSISFWVSCSESWYLEFTGGWLTDGTDVYGTVE